MTSIRKSLVIYRKKLFQLSLSFTIHTSVIFKENELLREIICRKDFFNQSINNFMFQNFHRLLTLRIGTPLSITCTVIRINCSSS